MNDATWIADSLAHVLIRASFVPPQPIQELRDLTRTRKQLTREIVQHTQRVQAVLEEANIKLSSVITNIIGASGRRIEVSGEGSGLAPQRSGCTPLDRRGASPLIGLVSRPDGRCRANRLCGHTRAVEESPGSRDCRWRLTAAGGDPRESATEKRPPGRGNPQGQG